LAVVVLSAVIVVADIIALNVAGEVSSEWWPLAVPVGLLLVPALGVVCLILLIRQRRRDNPTS
jgi:cytochrome bd-type quinol oxidase subunit 2